MTSLAGVPKAVFQMTAPVEAFKAYKKSLAEPTKSTVVGVPLIVTVVMVAVLKIP